MTKSDFVIEAKDLRKSYGTHEVLKGIDISVRRGTMLALLGPNGAGKTTTVRILSTLLKFDGGSVSVEGHDVAADPDAVRRAIGLTGQSAAVDEMLTGRENLVMMGRLYHLTRESAKARAEELLEEFDLVDAADRPLKTYSGGMRRRLDLAASLIATPPLIFLDEPTTGLDPRTRAQMWDTIRRLVADGATVLLTTQYLDEADQLADRIAVIDRGRVIADGTADELKAGIGGSSLHLTLADRALLEQARRVIGELLGVEAQITPEAGRLTAPLREAGLTTDLLIRLREHDIAIDEISVSKPSLDEVFLTITGHPADDDTERSAA